MTNIQPIEPWLAAAALSVATSEQLVPLYVTLQLNHAITQLTQTSASPTPHQPIKDTNLTPSLRGALAPRQSRS